MWTLGIDTSSSMLSCALQGPAGELFEHVSHSERSHNEALDRAVGGLFDAAGIGRSELGAIVVGAGPGSFTGLRISFGYAKGLALGLRIPLSGISSFQAAALDFLAPATLSVVVADARRSEVFYAAYTTALDGSMRTLVAECILPIGEVEEKNAGLAASQGLTSIRLLSPSPEGLPGILPEASASLGAALCRLCRPSNVAFSAISIGELAPAYLRRAAAKTIAERRAEGS